MRTRRRKRSSWDSGSGNVPAKSCGFCVAMTKNGSGRGMVWPSSETCPSFMPSRSADCVGDRAGERRLADAGYVLDEQMAAGEERDERELDGVLLAFERTLHSL